VIEIRSVGFGEDGLSFEFIDFSGDVRDNGMVRNQALLVPDNDAFHDEIVAVRSRMTRLLEGLVEDFASAQPVTPNVQLEDDGPSPYDNPLERDVT
jgi:hypothetical protein